MKKRCRVEIVVKVLGSLSAVVTILAITLAHAPALAELSDYNSQGLKATTLEEVLALPDEEIDLATAILILYKEWDASLDATASLAEIERMALDLGVRISPEDNPERIVSLINEYLFEEKGYSSLVLDPSDPGYWKLERWALPRVIENRKGDCLGLSLFYLALTERLRLPFYGVVVPGHIFVHYDDGKKKINIETLEKGKEYEDSYYEKSYMLHPTCRNYNFYLRNLLKRELIGLVLNDFGLAYYKKGMYDEAITEYKRAIEINPNLAETHLNLGLAYYDKGRHDEAITEYKRAIEINPNYAETHLNLGVAYYKKGMYDEAITEYKRAIEINLNDAEAHNNLAVAYYYKEEYSLAIEHCDRAIELGYRVDPRLLEFLEPYREK